MIPATHVNAANIVALSGLSLPEVTAGFDALIDGMERQLHHALMRDKTNWTLSLAEAKQLRGFLLGLRGGTLRDNDRLVSLQPKAEDAALSHANLTRRYIAYKSLLGLFNRVTISMRQDLDRYKSNRKSARPMSYTYLIELEGDGDVLFHNVFTLVALLAAHVRKMLAAIDIWLRVLDGTATEDNAAGANYNGLGYELSYQIFDSWGE